MSGLGPRGREILDASDRELSRNIARAFAIPAELVEGLPGPFSAVFDEEPLLVRSARAVVEYEELRRSHRLGAEILEARARAHAKHGDRSIEGLPADSPEWLAVLVEEVGEVAHALTYDATDADLEGELVDVLAVASAWLDASRSARGDA